MRIRLDHTYTAEELAHVTNGKTLGKGAGVTHLTTDSREVEPGDLFVALRGETIDGNRYVADAARRGASILLAERDSDSAACTVCVPDTWQALGLLAGAARARIAPTVIGITGSAGKTTTKNMIAAVLESGFRTHKTQKNQNNFLGLCLTLLSMPADTEMLVVEMGMNHAGEIAALSHIATPDIAVITNIGRAHIGNLGSRAGIAAAKAEILQGCSPGALCLIPAGEPLLEKAIPDGLHIMRIGERPGCDCRYKTVSMGSNTTLADFLCHTVSYEAIPLPGIGRHLTICAAFALTIGQTLGIPHGKICRALSTVKNEAMRQEIIRKHGITMIVDCYNASPESTRAAAQTLCTMAHETGGRGLALLGDMLELGEETRRLHEEVGTYYAKQGVDLLFTFGAAAENIGTGARRAGMPAEHIYSNPDPASPQASAAQINAVLRPGDVLLLKASRAMASERILSYLHFPNTEEKDATK